MEKHLFEERQYLGSNKYSLFARIVLAIFCFVAYYWSENPKPVDVSGITIGSYPAQNIPNSGALFFVMGIVVLLLSAILVFVLHIKTVVKPGEIIINGLWTARIVKIPSGNIAEIKIKPYSQYSLNRPAYNLHKNGVIRFYTWGSNAVEITDKEGLKYLVGTQRPGELAEAIRNSSGKDLQISQV
jgi:hypothetical protein